MPTYEYKCSACDELSDIFHSMSDKPKRKCPACGKLALERMIGTGGAIIFKGSGFYHTDYRSESYKKGAEAEKKESTPSESAKKDSPNNDKSTTPKKDAAKPAKKP